ncbi:MAG: 1,4-dihydroxy-2-naphthoate polyprenyltransferase [Acidimicrobiales bacterium]|nr:1,4-dihydroxy-2-naphthoate polyprenyltransferase [Acidimicrobiales bacterium]
MSNKWILGARPKTLPAAIVPVLLGTAASFEEEFSLFPAILCLIVSLALQVGVNYANDYSDGVRGNDGPERTGPTRLVGGGLASTSEVLKASLIMFVIAALSGVCLAIITTLWLIPIGLACFLGAWFYTGGSKPYGYRGFGEVSVFVFFGLIATNGSFFAQLEKFAIPPFLLSCVTGLLSCALLTVNNLRDYENDKKVEKRTLSVLMGEKASRNLFGLMVITSLFLSLLVCFWHVWVLLVLIAIPPLYRSIRIVYKANDITSWNNALKSVGILQISFGALLTVGLLISS